MCSLHSNVLTNQNDALRCMFPFLAMFEGTSVEIGAIINASLVTFSQVCHVRSELLLGPLSVNLISLPETFASFFTKGFKFDCLQSELGFNNFA